ncbi:MAG: RES domain-containing protein [Candidatus Arcticimaribacter sp.]|nr:RES family NAD+ phosphorylase [Flavobacteriaceae bacterium]MDB9899839.1 RES family NAD+ phosphorylase [Flavobacteriaceae bacterium]PSR09996.1 MAG: RES domain-containing protein [Candidatus Arcticimaribacter sp.]PTM00089.1 MAG: RES domain-containing protein [Candidatus Arcticimaribacter sp.]
MIVYRIAKKEYIEDLSGNGAKRTGGRWNSKGTPVLYCASTSSLAILEKLVSIDMDLLPDDLCIAALEIPKSKILKIPEEELPKNWNHYPSPDALKSIGKSWIELGNFCTLQIPSAVNPMESNYLINVKHPLMEKIKIKEVTPFRIDNRLSKY